MPSICRFFLVALTINVIFSGSVQAQVQQQLKATLAPGTASKRFDLAKSGLQALTATWASGEFPDKLEYRQLLPNRQFGEWQAWNLHSEGNSEAAGLLLLPGEVELVEVRATSLGSTQLTAASYTPNKQAAKARQGLPGQACNCPSPAVVGRQAWCPSGDCEPRGTGTPVSPEHIIVHHSAQNLSGVDFALVVRAIYDYHTGTNGWDDIGYNLLVSPDGEVYEGRGLTKQGAHYCGKNAGTLGVCMLGNYSESEVTRASYAALRNVNAFLSCAYSILPNALTFHAPSGKTLLGIEGHRSGCATICPGEHVNLLLPRLRDEVTALLQRGCAALPAPANLVVTRNAQDKPLLSWTRYVGASQVMIERSSGSISDFTVIGEVAGTETQFVDAAPEAGSNYYRIRVLKDGFLGDYSNEVIFEGTASFGHAATETERLRLAINPTGGELKVIGLKEKVDMAYVLDGAGRSVLELNDGEPRWSIRPGAISRGQYWLMIFSGNEWYTVPFEYQVAG